MAHEDVVNRKLTQRVVCGEDRTARIAEDFIDALADKCCPDDFGSRELGVVIFLDI